jgi:hypothetical protein
MLLKLPYAVLKSRSKFGQPQFTSFYISVVHGAVTDANRKRVSRVPVTSSYTPPGYPLASSYSQLDITQNKCDMMMRSETLATPSAGLPILTLSPSFELDNLARSHALAELDVNRQDTKATTNKYEISVTTPTKAPKRYDASHHTHVQNSPIQSSIMESQSPRKKRTRSENIPRVHGISRSDGRNGPAATKDNCDFRMSKPHAIYTQSLYVPFLESPSYFLGSSTEGRKGQLQLFNEDVSDSYLSDDVFFSEMLQAFVSESGTTLSNANSDGQISPSTIGRVIPSKKPLQVLMLKSLGSVTKNERYRGLNYHRLSRVYPFSAEARLHIIYPEIVREMFTDIDRAIQEWKQI